MKSKDKEVGVPASIEELVDAIVKMKKRLGMPVNMDYIKSMNPVELESQYQHYREVFKASRNI